jgi:hypothetical protein
VTEAVEWPENEAGAGTCRTIGVKGEGGTTEGVDAEIEEEDEEEAGLALDASVGEVEAAQ